MTRSEQKLFRELVTALKHLDRAHRALGDEIHHREPKPKRGTVRIWQQIENYYERRDERIEDEGQV